MDDVAPVTATAPVRFDQAWKLVNDFATAQFGSFASRVVLIRDLTGRVRIAIDDRQGSAELPSEATRATWAGQLDRALGRFSPGKDSLILVASRMFAPDEIFHSPDALDTQLGAASSTHRTLDRQITGADWLRPRLGTGTSKRLTLFGIKGGVGRSTAAVALTSHLARRGKSVLLIDLDLESPGVGTTLLSEDATPDFGVVDWFVEEAVGQADDGLLREMVGRSPLAAGSAEVLVVPAGGRPREGYQYLPKLARVYADGGAGDGTTGDFGARLSALVTRLEEQTQPDLTILDSRAGMHDLAAVAVTRLGATSLLFAIDTAQTWAAYRTLFEAWLTHQDRAAHFREDLRVVAAQVPETESQAYLERLREQAYRLFMDCMYEPVAPGSIEGFNFDLTDSEAPHAPLPIRWSRSLQQYDPVRRPGAVTDIQIEAACGDFVRGVADLFDGLAP